jgi:hypothetical protein
LAQKPSSDWRWGGQPGGGHRGAENEGAEAAVQAVKNSYYDKLEDLAAAYAVYIVQGHVFMDGNKRTGPVLQPSDSTNASGSIHPELLRWQTLKDCRYSCGLPPHISGASTQPHSRNHSAEGLAAMLTFLELNGVTFARKKDPQSGRRR